MGFADILKAVFLEPIKLIVNEVIMPLLKPIIEGILTIVAKILEEAIPWFVNNFLIDIIWTKLLQPLAEKLWDALFKILKQLAFLILRLLLRVIKLLQKAFEIFAGTSNVTYFPNGNEVGQKDNLLNILFHNKIFSSFFWKITLIGVCLCVIFAVYAIIVNTFDLNDQDNNKRTVGNILGDCGKALLIFLVGPLVISALLNLSTKILEGIQNSFETQTTRLDTIMFCMFASEATLQAPTNQQDSTQKADAGDFQELPFIDYLIGTKDYFDEETVIKDFDIQEIDYVLGILSSLFIVLMLALASFNFVTRIFDLILLYLTVPLFIASVPLDGGEKFKEWRSFFIAKVVTGYGSIIAMNIYLICAPIMINKIHFVYPGGNFFHKGLDYILRVIFLAGGMYAIYRAQGLFTQSINYQVGGQESRNIDTAFGGTTSVVSAVASLGARGVSAGAGAISSGISSLVASQMQPPGLPGPQSSSNLAPGSNQYLGSRPYAPGPPAQYGPQYGSQYSHSSYPTSGPSVAPGSNLGSNAANIRPAPAPQTPPSKPPNRPTAF